MRQITEEQAERLVTAMREAFEEVEVDADEIERLEAEMTNEPKDRHVLAAAVAAGSELTSRSTATTPPLMHVSHSASRRRTQTTF